tara:strand:- start:3867 stop:4016 length:150 start_codon:yes stop_codon:yes gene_type:complete
MSSSLSLAARKELGAAITPDELYLSVLSPSLSLSLSLSLYIYRYIDIDI